MIFTVPSVAIAGATAAWAKRTGRHVKKWVTLVTGSFLACEITFFALGGAAVVNYFWS